ncbi:MAG: extracellular solute-binding protein, partial [Phormidesmis sp.]
AAGLVYATDAQLTNRVKVVAIAPANSHPPIRYPIAILQRSDHPEAAQQYIDFLSDSDIAQIFERYGFNQR